MRPLFNGLMAVTIGVTAQACLNEPGEPRQNEKPVASQATEPEDDASSAAFALSAPTTTDMWRLRMAVMEQKLGRMTAIADTFALGAHVATNSANAVEENLDQEFLAAFHDGEYHRIDEFIGRFSALIPNGDITAASPKVMARLGFLNIWRFGERYRMLPVPGAEFPLEAQAQIQQGIGACSMLFQGAAEASPHNAVYRGFAAICSLAFGQATESPEVIVKALELGADAIRRNPEFNLFTLGYVLSAQPVGTRQFGLGLEMLWRNLDVCFDEKIDRKNPDIRKYLKNYIVSGNKKYCLNSDIAPYNFEGFFLVLGDVLVKAGKPDVAKVMYGNAKLLPSYQTWPLRQTLEQRITNANNLVAPFAELVNMMQRPIQASIIFDSPDNCMVCHKN